MCVGRPMRWPGVAPELPWGRWGSYPAASAKNPAEQVFGGGGGIRTHGRLAPSLVFKTDVPRRFRLYPVTICRSTVYGFSAGYPAPQVVSASGFFVRIFVEKYCNRICCWIHQLSSSGRVKPRYSPGCSSSTVLAIASRCRCSRGQLVVDRTSIARCNSVRFC